MTTIRGTRTSSLSRGKSLPGRRVRPLPLTRGWNPRGDSPTDLPRAPLPTDITTTPANWSVAQAAVPAGDGDATLVFDTGSTVAVELSGLGVPAGSVIRSAHVQFTAAAVDDSDVVLSIHGVIDESGSETEPVTWAPGAWETDERGAFQQTPDLSGIIREIVASPGWEPGGNLTLVVRAEGAGRRAAVSFEGDAGQAPGLRLEYSEGR